MKIKNERGVTVVDIVLTVIVISLFIGVIAILSNDVQMDIEQINRHSEALYYAIDTIENLKVLEFSRLPKAGTDKIDGVDDGYIADENGNATPFYRTITVQDYTEIPGRANFKQDVIKKITVQIDYKYKNQDKTISLSLVKTNNEGQL